jgi:hypothetical protein
VGKKVKEYVTEVVKKGVQAAKDVGDTARMMVPGEIFKAGLKKAKGALDKVTKR